MAHQYKINSEDLIVFTQKLIKEKSLSGQEGGVAKLVQNEMRKLGFEVGVDEYGNVTGEIDFGPGPCILIDSHMDTVGITDEEKWTYNPEGERTENRLYGRGTMDMKGPLAASIYGAASLKEHLATGKIVISATIAEELVEGYATIKVAERVKPDFSIICEATKQKIARGQRGRAEIKVEIFGEATHSSRPDLGVNAAEVMGDVQRELRSLQPPKHEVLGEGILVLTDVLSSPYPANSVVPNYCISTYDRRTLPNETEAAVLKPIEEIVSKIADLHGAQYKVSYAIDEFNSYSGKEVVAENFAPAWFFDEKESVVQLSRQGLQRVKDTAELGYYAFTTNGSGTAGKLNIPTIGFGPGREELAHRVDEYIELEDLITSARGYAAIIEEILNA